MDDLTPQGLKTKYEDLAIEFDHLQLECMNLRKMIAGSIAHSGVLSPTEMEKEYNQIAADLAAVQRDEEAKVDAFAKKMKDKLAKARASGRNGWQRCEAEELRRLLMRHLLKGDPVDVANFCMFLSARGAGIGDGKELYSHGEPRWSRQYVVEASDSQMAEDFATQRKPAGSKGRPPTYERCQHAWVDMFDEVGDPVRNWERCSRCCSAREIGPEAIEGTPLRKDQPCPHRWRSQSDGAVSAAGWEECCHCGETREMHAPLEVVGLLMPAGGAVECSALVECPGCHCLMLSRRLSESERELCAGCE